MARRSNTIETVQVTLSTSPQVRDWLEALSRTGLYGRNPAEVAAALIQERLRGMMQSGEIQALQQQPPPVLLPDPA